MCVCEGGRCVCACIGTPACTPMSSTRAHVREEERLGKGRGRVLSRTTESPREQVRCRHPPERVTLSKGGTFQTPPLLPLSPWPQPDYLAEIESLRGGKNQESKSQPPSSCGSEGLIRRELQL